tara:strand:+ start:1324 stop:1716 length:393 start_codon:yes stop_codon:yes gene_type:complete
MTDADILELMGARFQFGGRGPEFFDCWGLVGECFRRAGKPAPIYETPNTREAIARYISGQLDSCWKKVERTPGSAVVIRFPDPTGVTQLHVGYVLDDTYFLHASETAQCVARERLSAYHRNIMGFYVYDG